MRRTTPFLTAAAAAALLSTAVPATTSAAEATPAAAVPAQPAPHGKQFWRAIQASRYVVPRGESAVALLRELSGDLGSPDAELRDDFGYTFPYVWIKQLKVVAPDDLRWFLAAWTANLRAGVGETGTDSVLLRSFSALDLSILADLDVERPFLTSAERASLLDAALAYLRDERDLRGYDLKKGWIHSAAHTADLLGFLAAGRTLRVEDQGRILRAVAAKLATPVYAWGETERMAHAVLAILERPDFDAAAFDAFLGELDREAKPLWKEKPFDPARFAAVENGDVLLRSLYLQLTVEPHPARETARAKILAALAAR